MKRIFLSGIIGPAVSLLFTQAAEAQGTLYLSSLSETPTGTASAGSNSWLAAGFGTGNNAGGYVLNSIQLGMADASGNPNGFTVTICPGVEDPVDVGSSIGTLTGSANPATAGTYTYSSISGLSLTPSTAYYIVITAGTAIANGAYNWNESAYPPGVNNWGGVNNGLLVSGNGGSRWSATPYLGIAQFAIFATPAPEPGLIGLFALGGLLVGFQRWKARSVL
jgi:hypothetical protein